MSSDSYLHRRIGGRKGKMRLAHHIIWEEKNGPIPEGYEVHHIDHDKKNNDIENLVLLTISDHQRMHSPYYALVNGSWVKICPDCKKADSPRMRRLCDPCRARRARIERRSNNVSN